MKRMGKSILALVLAYAMVIGNLGSGAFATTAVAAEDIFAWADEADADADVFATAEDAFAEDVVADEVALNTFDSAAEAVEEEAAYDVKPATATKAIFAVFDDVPEFDYEYDNNTIIQQWRDLLGKKKPTHKYNPSSRVIVEILMDYRDIQLNRYMKPHELHRMTSDRAKELQDKGLVKIINTIC
jgi:hypothetical protein